MAESDIRQTRLIYLMITVSVAMVTTTIGVILTVVILRNTLTEIRDVLNEGTMPTSELTSQMPGIIYNQVLRDYCQQPDSSYSYSLLPEYTVIGVTENVTTFILNMTSQSWSHPDVVGDRHIWWHYLAVTIPSNVTYKDVALIYITSGDNTDSPPDPKTDTSIQAAIQFADGMGMVVATIFQVPNQPIRFSNDHSDSVRFEDDIIAFTLNHFFSQAPDDPTFLLHVPMTKSVVRAMDTVSSFANSRINRFYLTGVSKRGWTAWLTAAVDERVVGVIPQVFDLLNLRELLRHYPQSLKGWTFVMEPYYSQNVTYNLDEPNFQLGAQVVDALEYREMLTMPKYIILSGNDEFLLPDNTHYFLDQLRGPTFIRMHPNVGHSIGARTAFIISEIQAFIISLEEKWIFPEIRWSRYSNDTHGGIKMETRNQKPVKVAAFKADTRNTEDRRDFRLHVLTTMGPRPSLVMYNEINVTEVETNIFVAETEVPQTGWSCFFIEAEFESAQGRMLRLTSEVNIIPETFPVEPCRGRDCYGTLV